MRLKDATLIPIPMVGKQQKGMKMNAITAVDEACSSVYKGRQTDACAGIMSARIPIRPQAAKKQKRGVVSLRDKSNNRIDRATNGMSPNIARVNNPSPNCRWAISFIDTLGAISPTVISSKNMTIEGVTMPTIRMKHRHDHRNASNFMWIESFIC